MARSTKKSWIEIKLQRAKKIRGRCRTELKERPESKFRQEQVATWENVVAKLELEVKEKLEKSL
tara:strand:+ start:195 stop:386 length:192 start_codon:yes stop_codon:yes gene_type:complete